MNRAERRRNKKLTNKGANKAWPLQPSLPLVSELEQTLTTQDALYLATQHLNLGDLTKAESIYQQILQAEPQQPIALHFLGVISYQAGKTDKAFDLISKALTIKPDYVDAHYNLGIVLQSLLRLDEAKASYKNTLAIKPDYAEAHSNLGNTFKDLGQLDEAIASYKNALAIKPDYAEAHSNLGNVFKDLGQLDEAVSRYKKAITIKPNYVEAYSNLGVAFKDLGQFDKAVESYNKALAIKADYTEAFHNLCELYDNYNRVSELKKTIDQAQKTLPRNNPYLLYRMAQIASREKRHEDARYFLELVDPVNLSQKTGIAHSELLAKTYDKLGKYTNAYIQFEITNKMTRQSFEAKQYSGRRYFDKISELTESWSRVSKIKWPIEQTSVKPHSLAFLVGFPRSGTTLLDTILRSHPELTVVEEKPIVDAMNTHIGGLATTECLTNLNDAQIADLRAVYYEELYSHITPENSDKLIIDKFPLNIINVGLVHRVFPEAKFILALRHPIDSVLSCFMQSFELNDAMANFLTFQKSAKLYAAVMTLWMHYTKTLDLKVETVKYEDLVQDLQGVAEPLVNFLGFNWHDNLLSYQQTALSRGKINTPSYNQVTQSLYTQAIGRWGNYRGQIEGERHHLEPWVKSFGY